MLETLNVEFTVRVTDAPEIEQGEDAAAVAVENALRKARAASRPGAREVVLACDTIVVLEGVIYGKPPDVQGARATLRALAGRTHEVLSGLAVLVPDERACVLERTTVARTQVTFRALDEHELERQLEREEWRGRSGGYAIQGGAADLAVALEGERDNVVGLPLNALLELYPQLVQNHSQP